MFLRTNLSFVFIFVLLLTVGCASPNQPDSVEPTIANTEVAQVTSTPVLPSHSPIHTPSPAETNTPTHTATSTPTHTPTHTATYTPRPTETETPLPTLTHTASPTVTPLPPSPTFASVATAETSTEITATAIIPQPTAVPTAVAAESTETAQGNLIPLAGGAYGACPFLTLGQYQTSPEGCPECSRDLLHWLIGGAPDYPEGTSTTHQVLGAYEYNGEIFLQLTGGLDVSLGALNYRDIRVITDLERALGTWGDSFSVARIEPHEFLSYMREGVTVSYTINTAYGWKAIGAGTICEQ